MVAVDARALDLAWATGALDAVPEGALRDGLSGRRVVSIAEAASYDGALRSLVAVAAVRDAFARFDGAALDEAARALDPIDAGWAAIARHLRRCLGGLPSIEPPPVGLAAPFAAAVARAGILLTQIAAGDPEATDGARALVREAAASGHREAHVVAVMVLARARRVVGRPHLCRRILAGLDHAPRGYDSWRALEGLLAGDGASPLARALDTSLGAPHALHELIASAAGELTDARRELTELTDALRGDGRSAFVRGETSSLHHHAEVAVASTAPMAAVAVVPGRAGQRILRPSFADYLGSAEGGRTEDAIATLALAGPPGLDVPALFRAVYGFVYKPTVHDGAFRVLLTRIRQTIEGAASLERVGDRVHLVARAPFAVVDSRVRAPIESPVVSALTTGVGASAKALAERLGMPLRTVQAELQRLVDEGVCVRLKLGREAAYQIEDTTFRSSPVSADGSGAIRGS